MWQERREAGVNLVRSSELKNQLLGGLGFIISVRFDKLPADIGGVDADAGAIARFEEYGDTRQFSLTHRRFLCHFVCALRW